MSTFTPKTADIQRAWLEVDATGLTLGRLATEVASRLRGKHKAIFTPHVDTGDHVIIVNADKVAFDTKTRGDLGGHPAEGQPGGVDLEPRTLDICCFRGKRRHRFNPRYS